MKEMAKEMPFPFELYDHLHDGRFGELKLLKREPVRIQYRAENLFTSKVCCKGKKAIAGWFQFNYLLDLANLGDGGQ